MSDTGCGILDAGFWILDPGYGINSDSLTSCILLICFGKTQAKACGYILYYYVLSGTKVCVNPQGFNRIWYHILHPVSRILHQVSCILHLASCILYPPSAIGFPLIERCLSSRCYPQKLACDS